MGTFFLMLSASKKSVSSVGRFRGTEQKKRRLLIQGRCDLHHATIRQNVLQYRDEMSRGHCCEKRTKCFSLQIAVSIPKSPHITISAPTSISHCSLFLLHVQILCGLHRVEQRRRDQQRPHLRLFQAKLWPSVINIFLFACSSAGLLNLWHAERCLWHSASAAVPICFARTASLYCE